MKIVHFSGRHHLGPDMDVGAPSFSQPHREKGGRPRCHRLFAAIVFTAISFVLPASARAQVVPSAYAGAPKLSAGVLGSGEYIQYGGRKMIGITGFVDADTWRHYGLEFEGRWVDFHQTADVHLATYSAGVRYHFDIGRRFQPYAKGLVGVGDFNFPYNLATGSYLVVTAGGGLDYRLNHRFTFRAADFEYQDWPQFTFGNMTTPSVSTGLRVNIF